MSPDANSQTQSELGEAIEKAQNAEALKLQRDSHAREHELEKTAHRREHEVMELSLDKAHDAASRALKAALDDHHREHAVHAAAHEREHIAHTREHELNQIAVQTAANAVDRRLEGMNEVRQQLREQATAFASSERVEALAGEINRRFGEANDRALTYYEENRKRIEAIEKGDVKSEGKSLGQGTVIAIIVGAISLVATILGILVVIANLATATP